MENKFYQQLGKGVSVLGLTITDEGLSNLLRYYQELKKWKTTVNLVAKSATDEQILENHLLDSLTLIPYLRGNECHLLDIGTGAGFPGLVCKAVLPDLKVSLIEPRLKRVSFLKHIVRTLRLTEVDIYAERLEDVSDLSEKTPISHITSRAVAEIGPFLNMVERFHVLRPKLIMMKGPKWNKELNTASEIVDASSFDLKEVVDCTLPFSGAQRSLLFFKVTN